MTVPDSAAAPNYIPAKIAVAGDQGYSIDGQIWSASERFLRIITGAPIGVTERIEMSIDGCTVNGEVAFCQSCPEGYNVGVQLQDRDSVRREPRFPLDLPATLTVVGLTGPTGGAVRLSDVSASGVGLFSSTPAPVGACVEINLDMGLLFGEVRHCQKSDEGRFRIGIAIYHMFAREHAVKPARAPLPRFAWLRRNGAAIRDSQEK